MANLTISDLIATMQNDLGNGRKALINKLLNWLCNIDDNTDDSIHMESPRVTEMMKSNRIPQRIARKIAGLANSKAFIDKFNEEWSKNENAYDTLLKDINQKGAQYGNRAIQRKDLARYVLKILLATVNESKQKNTGNNNSKKTSIKKEPTVLSDKRVGSTIKKYFDGKADSDDYKTAFSFVLTDLAPLYKDQVSVEIPCLEWEKINSRITKSTLIIGRTIHDPREVVPDRLKEKFPVWIDEDPQYSNLTNFGFAKDTDGNDYYVDDRGNPLLNRDGQRIPRFASYIDNNPTVPYYLYIGEVISCTPVKINDQHVKVILRYRLLAHLNYEVVVENSHTIGISQDQFWTPQFSFIEILDVLTRFDKLSHMKPDDSIRSLLI